MLVVVVVVGGGCCCCFISAADAAAIVAAAAVVLVVAAAVVVVVGIVFGSSFLRRDRLRFFVFAHITVIAMSTTVVSLSWCMSLFVLLPFRVVVADAESDANCLNYEYSDDDEAAPIHAD